jgi:hypothetical protein
VISAAENSNKFPKKPGFGRKKSVENVVTLEKVRGNRSLKASLEAPVTFPSSFVRLALMGFVSCEERKNEDFVCWCIAGSV